MGLDVSHDCWHGAYSAFMRWRVKLAEVAGLPPLELMEGFFSTDSAINNPCWEQWKADNTPGGFKDRPIWSSLPIKWESLKYSPLHILLHHSDCDGQIEWKDCGAIADALEPLIELLPDKEEFGHIGHWRKKTEQFVRGLRLAHRLKENVDFH